jgi:hypothetical protein
MVRVAAELTVANNRDVLCARYGEIPLGHVRKLTLTAVVKTGTMPLVIPKSSATQLGLAVPGMIGVFDKNRHYLLKPYVNDVWLSLLGREGVYRAVVEADCQEAQIGMIVFQDLDLLVDAERQALYPRDPKMITSEI